jgi:crotonobetainyl-CoA:carnitine CoA-transferase CaiB-like acyl-CoA transferase
MVLEGPAFAATGMPSPRAMPAPALGEHTREICRDVLGLDDAAVDALVAAGALEEPGQSGRPPVTTGEPRS